MRKSHWAPLAGGLVTAAWLMMSAAPLLAAKRVGEGSTLKVNVRERTITDSSSKDVTVLLDAKSKQINTFELRSDDKAIIAIEDYNPILFTYEFKQGTAKDTPDYLAALGFAKELAKLISGFSMKGRSDQMTFDGLDLDSFRRQLAQIGGFVERIPGWIRLAHGTRDEIAQLKRELREGEVAANVKQVESAYDKVQKLLNTCVQTGVLVSDQKETVDCNESLGLVMSTQRATLEAALAKAVAEVEQANARLAQENQFVADISTAAPATNPPAAVTTAIDNAKGRREAAATALKQAQTRQATAEQNLTAERKKAGSQTILQFLQSVKSMEFAVREQLRLLSEFGADVAEINQLKVLDTTPYSIQNQPGVLSVKARQKYDAVMSPASRAFRAEHIGDYAFEFKPYQPARLSVGGAVVMGLFIKNPEFTAEKDGEDFAIKRKDDDPAIFKVAAMLNITPAGWGEPTFGGYFQVGVTPDPDAVGIYLGSGIRAQTIFSFGAGLMLQQVKKLGPGLTLDTRLDDPAKLKTVSEFKPGLYFHFTVALPQ
jgi:hypothetical protein